MKKNTSKFTLTAILAALAVAFLMISSIMPTASIGLAAIAGLFTAAAVIEAGLSYGFMCWAAASVVGFFVVPDKASVLLFALILGLYPVIKSPIEGLNNLPKEWLLKLVYVNAVCALCALAYKFAFVEFPIVKDTAVWIVWVVCVAVFCVYDIGLTKAIGYYMERISPRIRRKK